MSMQIRYTFHFTFFISVKLFIIIRISEFTLNHEKFAITSFVKIKLLSHFGCGFAKVRNCFDLSSFTFDPPSSGNEKIYGTLLINSSSPMPDIISEVRTFSDVAYGRVNVKSQPGSCRQLMGIKTR